ncbi:permease-like cell division protein FtsX [Actinoplanes sp. NPDC024001]|uniref:permease-like cell division protein FtsX n=1 Tax=Actinoplanes sp. NPDC024001 TaxID=3154598 RepID=UPI003401603D
MNLHLRDQFDRAVSDDPGAALDEMASAAMVEGGRLRRRRTRRVVLGVAGGMVAVVGALTAVNLPSDPSAPVTVAAAMMPPTAPSCVQHPVEVGANHAVVFVEASQQAAVGEALRGDPRVDALEFESRALAYERFRDRWAQEPDLLAAVSAEQFPESFRVRLVDAGQFAAFRERYAAMAGVDQIIGRKCGQDAPVGGVL